MGNKHRLESRPWGPWQLKQQRHVGALQASWAGGTWAGGTVPQVGCARPPVIHTSPGNLAADGPLSPLSPEAGACLVAGTALSHVNP